METLKTICSRKSVRAYTGEAPTMEEMNQIMKAAYAAPVGMAKYDTLQLTIVVNKEYLAKLDAAAGAFFGDPNRHPLYGAPMLVIVSSVLTGSPADNVAHANGACIVENMALEAVDLGIGSVHIYGAIAALNQNPDLVAELKLPEGHSPICAIALGKTTETYEEREIPDKRIKTELFV